MENTKKKRRNDIILLAGLLLLGVILFVVINELKADGGQVEVVVNGKVTESYPLNKNKEIDLDYNGHNKLVIYDGYASITDADCPDKLCVNQPNISKTGETIVCLPHKVIIKISGGDESEFDAVVQ